MGLQCKKVRILVGKFEIKPPKETKLGVALALFDP